MPRRLEGTTTINTGTIVAAVVGAVFGGAGLTGLVFAYMRRFIDKRLDQREKDDAKRRATRLRRATIEDEWQHAVGRLFYHIHKYIETGHANGDLEAAWQRFQEAENKKKDLDREILVENKINE